MLALRAVKVRKISLFLNPFKNIFEDYNPFRLPQRKGQRARIMQIKDRTKHLILLHENK